MFAILGPPRALRVLDSRIAKKTISGSSAAHICYTVGMPLKRDWRRTIMTPPDRRPPEPERDVQGRVTTHEAAVALAKMSGPKLSAHGIKVNACEGFHAYNRQRRRWLKHRARELGVEYGSDLSSGVGARLRAAAWGIAFGEWLCARAAEAGDAGLANLALSVAEKGLRQDEAAQQQAEREKKLRDRANTQHTDVAEVLDV